MALRRNRLAVTLRSCSLETHVHVEPRFSLTLATGQKARADAGPSEQAFTSSPRVHRIVETIVQRLAARAGRTESVSPDSTAVGLISYVSLSTTVARHGSTPLFVYRTPAVELRERVVEVRRDSPSTPDAHQAQWARPPHRVDSPRPEPVSGVDIGHLTDKVVQALDRRILAHRERLGKR